MDDAGAPLARLLDEVGKIVVGQRPLLEGLFTGLLCDGHVLVEGVPGLAKTTAVRTLAQALGLGFGLGDAGLGRIVAAVEPDKPARERSGSGDPDRIVDRADDDPVGEPGRAGVAIRVHLFARLVPRF